MKKKLRTLFVMLACLGICLISSGKVLAADPIELSFVCEYHERLPVVQKVFIPWCKSIEEKSKGRVKINYYGPNTLVPQRDAYEATVNGMVDILGVPVLYTTDRFPELSLLALPFIASGGEAGTLVAMEMLNKFPKMRARFNDTKLLGAWAAASLQLHTSKKLVKTLDDLKGLRVIVFDSNMVKQAKALGANPVIIPPPEIYMALQRGVADGLMFPLAPLMAMKITEVTKYHTIIDIINGPAYFVMNKNRFNSLPPDIQKMIEETTGKKLFQQVGKLIDQLSVITSEMMKKSGHTFYRLPEDEKQKWIERINPVIDEILTDAEKKIHNAKEIYKEAQRLGKEFGKTTEGGYKD